MHQTLSAVRTPGFPRLRDTDRKDPFQTTFTIDGSLWLLPIVPIRRTVLLQSSLCRRALTDLLQPLHPRKSRATHVSPVTCRPFGRFFTSTTILPVIRGRPVA